MGNRPLEKKRPIQYRDILRAGNKTEAEIAAVEAELESLAAMEAMLQPA